MSKTKDEVKARAAELKAKHVKCPVCGSTQMGVVVHQSGPVDEDGQVFCEKCDFVFTA